jgi:hypothetical protein
MVAAVGGAALVGYALYTTSQDDPKNSPCPDDSGFERAVSKIGQWTGLTPGDQCWTPGDGGGHNTNGPAPPGTTKVGVFQYWEKGCDADNGNNEGDCDPTDDCTKPYAPPYFATDAEIAADNARAMPLYIFFDAPNSVANYKRLQQACEQNKSDEAKYDAAVYLGSFENTLLVEQGSYANKPVMSVKEAVTEFTNRCKPATVTASIVAQLSAYVQSLWDSYTKLQYTPLKLRLGMMPAALKDKVLADARNWDAVYGKKLNAGYQPYNRADYDTFLTDYCDEYADGVPIHQQCLAIYDASHGGKTVPPKPNPTPGGQTTPTLCLTVTPIDNKGGDTTITLSGTNLPASSSVKARGSGPGTSDQPAASENSSGPFANTFGSGSWYKGTYTRWYDLVDASGAVLASSNHVTFIHS